MKHTLGGPAIVHALVMAETAVGGLAVLWLSDAWGRTRMGFFKLVGGVLAAFAILAWLAARAPLLGGATVPAAARAGVAFLLSFAIATVVWQVLLWAGAHTLSKAIGILAVPIGVAVTVPAQVIAGRLDPLGLGFLILGTIVAFVIASRFWRLGLRSYTGASA